MNGVRKLRILTLPENLILLQFNNDTRGFQSFVTFIFLSFRYFFSNLKTICSYAVNYVLMTTYVRDVVSAVKSKILLMNLLRRDGLISLTSCNSVENK